jgi:seryl-tRNA synthetase
MRQSRAANSPRRRPLGNSRVAPANRCAVGELPNLPAEEVPDGPDESATGKSAAWASRRRFNFDPLPHEAIGEKLG